MRPLHRIDPAGPAHAYKTYAISSPIATHTRPGTCEEAGCLAYWHGWQTSVDEATELGQRQAHYIRTMSGRRFTERRTEIGLTAFTFEAGQKCFAEHRVSLDRPELYIVREGDWRGNPRGTDAYVHSGPDAWVNDFGDHQNKIARVVNG